MVKENAIRAVFSEALCLGQSESCLVVTDIKKEPIGRAFYEYARKITSRVKIEVMEPAVEHATEPSSKVARAMLEHDVQLLITDKSLTHTRARIEATSRGARVATMPSITEDMANRCLDVNYKALRRASKQLYEVLKGGEVIRVVSDTGTDIAFEAGKSLFFGTGGGILDHPGAYGNLPEGEVSFSPEICEGVYVVDASFPDLGILKEPVTFKVRGGYVYEITGRNSEKIVRRLDRLGVRAYKVAELGIGLNPKAKIVGKILEDEKVVGTAHIAVGNNLSYGGNNDVPLHLDGVLRSPDIYVGGRKLMENGRFLEEWGIDVYE